MPKRQLFIFGGAIGDALLGIQLSQTLRSAGSKQPLTILSTRRSPFVRELLESVPGVRYRELLHANPLSWLELLALAFSTHAVVFLEPFQNTVPRWWKLIARVATLMPGSVEVRCQSKAQLAPRRVRILSYSPQRDNLFSMIAGVVPLWGGPVVPAPTPSLPLPVCEESRTKPYILFHFFAGAYRRSLPLEKARPLLKGARTQFPDHAFVITCARGEEAAAREMIEGVLNTQIEVQPSAHELLCLLQGAEAVVGVASGVTHIASHLGLPAVILCNLSDPCWLPTYASGSILLAAREECRCNGDKTGECAVSTPGGLVYRCLYYIPTERIISEMKAVLALP